MKEIVAEIVHHARRSPDINQRSGVSVRASIALYEALLANAFRRALRTGESDVVPRISDLPFVLPAFQGKVEFESMEEGQEDRITERLVNHAVKAVFDRHYDVNDLESIAAPSWASSRSRPARARRPRLPYDRRGGAGLQRPVRRPGSGTPRRTGLDHRAGAGRAAPAQAAEQVRSRRLCHLHRLTRGRLTMRQFPTHHRFSQWDGSRPPALDADAILDALANDLMEYGDLRWAMRNMLSRGMRVPQGGAMRGLRDMLKQLRDRKRAQLQRYDLGSIFEDFRERLDDILTMERDRIGEWLDKDTGGDFSQELLKNIARNNAEQLDNLPPDLASQIRQLEKYEFINPDAQKKFLELLNELRQGMANAFFKNVENMVKNLSDGDIERMKDMLKALNDMLVKKIAGEEPDFDAFMEEFGDMFGDDPPQSLDELLEQMRQQMAAAQSLMNSLSPDQRQQLQSMLADRLGDPGLQSELAKLAKEMAFLDPTAAATPSTATSPSTSKAPCSS
jgi:hypothetical protein